MVFFPSTKALFARYIWSRLSVIPFGANMGLVFRESDDVHSFKDISTFIQEFHGKFVPYSFYSYQRDVDFFGVM